MIISPFRFVRFASLLTRRQTARVMFRQNTNNPKSFSLFLLSFFLCYFFGSIEIRFRLICTVMLISFQQIICDEIVNNSFRSTFVLLIIDSPLGHLTWLRFFCFSSAPSDMTEIFCVRRFFIQTHRQMIYVHNVKFVFALIYIRLFFFSFLFSFTSAEPKIARSIILVVYCLLVAWVFFLDVLLVATVEKLTCACNVWLNCVLDVDNNFLFLVFIVQNAKRAEWAK